MKLVYKNCLYEENYHFSPTGSLNDTYQRDLKETVDSILPQILEVLKEKPSYIPIRLKTGNPKLPKLYFHVLKNSNDGEIRKYEDGYLISLDDRFYNKELTNGQLIEVRKLISHEINHLYQIIDQNGINDYDATDMHDTNKEFKYFNNPKEINALLNSFIQILKSNEQVKNYFKQLSYDEFIKNAFYLIGFSEKKVNEYMDEYSTQTLYETLRFTYVKLKRNEI